jgi:hypothetical protein
VTDVAVLFAIIRGAPLHGLEWLCASLHRARQDRDRCRRWPAAVLERGDECGQSLCAVPSGAAPSPKRETWRAGGYASRDRRLLSTISPMAISRHDTNRERSVDSGLCRRTGNCVVRGSQPRISRGECGRACVRVRRRLARSVDVRPFGWTRVTRDRSSMPDRETTAEAKDSPTWQSQRSGQ